VDLTSVKDSLIDLAPGAMRGIRAEQEGIEGVKTELAASMPGHGAAADIPPQAYQRFLDRTALLVKLRQKEIELKKLVEICEETRAKTENDREDDISVIAKAAQSAADRLKDPGIAAPFEATIRYNGQIADKAAQTRRKNVEAKAEKTKEAPEAPATPPVGADPTPVK
jgi:hypothetical protein